DTIDSDFEKQIFENKKIHTTLMQHNHRSEHLSKEDDKVLRLLHKEHLKKSKPTVDVLKLCRDRVQKKYP
ncbi:MAG: hypothetical protein KAS32_26475, partial [Candidatus Peribacteraceae bacterium]|nr:hypothetical protein [Candidatus Peribacteraceae bacterium]